MEDRYWYWLNNIEGIGNAKIRNLLEMLGSPREIATAKEACLGQIPGLTQKDIFRLLDQAWRKECFEQYEQYKKEDLGILFPDHENYPDKLKELYDRPFVLYYYGRIPSSHRPTVSVVGSRNATAYGRSVAMELGRILAQNGVQVISGLAHGIDGEAHRGAVLAGGNTFAILAGGPDVCYPPDHYNLYMDIRKTGGILSEYPPGTRTVPGLFPMRNRIISGLSDAVIVVEAGTKSGSLITASFALDQNRRVFCVPGRIGDRASYGCNALIAQGAEIVTGYEELLTALGICEIRGANPLENLSLATDEKMLYSLLLDFTSKSLETLLEESHMEPGAIFTALIGLEMKGLIRETGKNFYVRLR